jgi:hypothetical protein
MRTLQYRMAFLVLTAFVLISPKLSFAESQIIVTTDETQPTGVWVAYAPPNNSNFQELNNLLRDRRALERIREVLGPLRLPESLTISAKECGAVNSWYRRENGFKPNVTICYEYLKHILDSLPTETTPEGLTPDDAAVGQFFS